MPKISIPAAGEAMPVERLSSKQYAFQVVRWIEAKLLRSCATAIVRTAVFRNLSRPIDRLRSMWGAKKDVEQEMTAAVRNGYKGEAGLSDESRLAKSFAKMEAAVEDAVSAADEALGGPRIATPRLDILSFVKRDHVAGGYDYWADIAPGASYTEDCATGRRLAKEFIDFIGEYHTAGNASLLGCIAIDMDARGATKGHKIGFMNTINEYAMAGGFVSRMTGKAPEMAPAATTDPLSETIEGHRRGMSEYARMPDFKSRREEDDAIARTLKPHSEALKHWNAPAATSEGAIEALKFMIEEEMFNDMAGVPLARAVIAYLQSLPSNGVQKPAVQKTSPQQTVGVGRYPLVPTGRGSWVSYSKTSLDELLARFDRAYPDYTDGTRESVIEDWKVAEGLVNDAEIRRLAEELKVAWEYERQCLAPDAAEGAFEAAYEASSTVVHRIRAIQAHTLEGLKAKALAISWCHSGDKVDFEATTTDLQLAADVINDLLAE